MRYGNPLLADGRARCELLDATERKLLDIQAPVRRGKDKIALASVKQ